MNADKRVEALESEVKLLKNEIKAILLDIREHYLDYQNPFTHGALPSLTDGEVNLETDPDGRTMPSKARSCDKPGETEAKPDPVATKLPATGAEDSRTPPFQIDDHAETPVCLSSARERRDNRERIKLDLSTIAGLSQWVEETVTLIGREKLEALVDVCYMSGRLPASAKDAILVMARPYATECVNKRITGKQYLTILARLDNVFGNDTQDTLALSSIISLHGERAKPKGRGGGNGHKRSVLVAEVTQ